MSDLVVQEKHWHAKKNIPPGSFDRNINPSVSLLTASIPFFACELKAVKPYMRGFFCGDTSITYPYIESEAISDVILITGGIIITGLTVRMHAYTEISLVEWLQRDYEPQGSSPKSVNSVFIYSTSCQTYFLLKAQKIFKNCSFPFNFKVF